MLSTETGEEPFGRMFLPCILNLQSANPASYSSSGISIANLSPFKQGLGNWLAGMSQTLFNACAKVFCCGKGLGLGFDDGVGRRGESKGTQDQGMMKG